MRLPYLQVAMEVIEQAAPDIAVELEHDEAAIGWGLVKLFRWALARCPDNLPPSHSDVVKGPTAARLIANAAGFRGDAEAFVEACARACPPLLERVPVGIRVRGLDRYDAAWENAQVRPQQRSARAKHAAEHRWSINRASVEHPKPDAEDMPGDALDPDTDTDAYTKAPPPPTPASAGRPPAEVVVGFRDVPDVTGIPRSVEVRSVRWEPTAAGTWEFIQLSRELHGLRREGKRPQGFDELVVRAAGDPGGLEVDLHDFLTDDSINAKGHPTAVFIACLKSRQQQRAVGGDP